MGEKAELRATVAKALLEVVRRYPEMMNLLDKPADCLLIEEELRQWEQACLSKGTAYIPHVPSGLRDMVAQMLGYTHNHEDVKTVFSDVLAFFKQDEVDDARRWHEKFKPNPAPHEYKPGKTELTQDDIDEALKTWNKAMPDYKGMLDAGVEVDD